MEYLLKASAIVTIFYLFYKIALQRETFFEANRLFFIIGILSALLIPLLVIPINIAQTPISFSPVKVITHNTVASVVKNEINWVFILKSVYAMGILFFGGKLLLSLFSIRKLIKTSKKENKTLYSLIETTQNVSPFSFFKNIVFNPNQFKKEELKQIIAHEKVHVNQLHTIDVLLSELLKILLWFNPFVWLFKKEIQQNLEFIADNLAQKKTRNNIDYQKLLLKNSLLNNQLIITNNFYNSLIKKRIIMLHKKRSKTENQWKYALILPLIAVFLATFNTKVVAQKKEQYVVSSFKYSEDSQGLGVKKDTIINISISTIVSKTTTKEQLNSLKHLFDLSEFEKVKIKFSKIKRNYKKEIIAIEVSLKLEKAITKYSVSSNEPIHSIKIKASKNREKIELFIGEKRNINIVLDSVRFFDTKKDSFLKNFIKGYSSVMKDDTIVISTKFKMIKFLKNKDVKLDSVPIKKNQ